LHGLINSKPTDPKHGHVVAAKPTLGEGRRPRIFERSGAESVETKNPRRLFGRHGEEAFRAAAFVVLPGVSFQVGVKIGITAIQGLAVVLLADRRFVPLHGNRKPTLAARSKRAVGAADSPAVSARARNRARSRKAVRPVRFRIPPLQNGAENVARKIEPLECGGTAECRLVLRPEPEFDAAAFR
jgi:hypothetical protein